MLNDRPLPIGHPIPAIDSPGLQVPTSLAYFLLAPLSCEE